MTTTNITLYVGPSDDRDTFNFNDASKWEGVHSQIENIILSGHGLLTVPREGGGTVNYVVGSGTELSWVDRP